jgi:hypothetical protein
MFCTFVKTPLDAVKFVIFWDIVIAVLDIGVGVTMLVFQRAFNYIGFIVLGAIILYKSIHVRCRL